MTKTISYMSQVNILVIDRLSESVNMTRINYRSNVLLILNESSEYLCLNYTYELLPIQQINFTLSH